MDSESLIANSQHFATMGNVLSVQQRSAMQSSLLRLKREHARFQRVDFWGKVKGMQTDYLISQGFETFDLPNPVAKTFYSVDAVTWKELPVLTKERLADASPLTGIFTGDASFVYKYQVADVQRLKELHEQKEAAELAGEEVPGDVAEALAEGTPMREVEVTETERLASVVSQINKECAVVPRGAYLLLPNARKGSYEVKANKAFQGLTVNACGDTKSYLHTFCNDKLMGKTLVEREMMDKSVDFLDSLEEDEPQGTWSSYYDPSTGANYLRNLSWPGFLFFNVPCSTNYGYCYFGTGEKNADIAFML